MGIIYFNGVSSETVNIVVEHPPKLVVPERNYTITHIPGRNGDFLLDDGSFENVDIPYEIAVNTEDGYFETMIKVAAWLHSNTGYARLSDSYDSTHFRLAFYKDTVEFENLFNEAGRGEITFNAMPQRFLVSGEDAVEMTESGEIENPTLFTALPTITISGTEGGSGTISCGGNVLTISNIYDGMILDSTNQNATTSSGASTANNHISGEFPVIPGGVQTIGFTGDITSISIIPNWWTI